MSLRRVVQCLAALGLMAIGASARADVTLSLVPDQPAYLVGATVTVRVQMSSSSAEVWGGQFFLAYNSGDLAFVSATTGDAPFTHQIYSVASSPNIDYAVGAADGTTNGATTPTTLAVLKFTAINPVPSTAGLVSFRSHSPPTRLTDNNAQAISFTPADLTAISISAFAGTPTYADDNYVGKASGTTVNFPDNGLPGPHAIGVDAFATIQGAINAVNTGGTTYVAAGSYNEDVNVNKDGLSVLGAGVTSVVSGPIGGLGSTFVLSGSNITLAGFKITRDGNNTTDWNNPNLNTAGVSIQGTGYTGNVIRDNLITQMRTGIDINNSSGHTVRNNVITDNRTGLIFRNQTDNLVVAENEITSNWTVGIVFLDGSGGTNSPVQTAANCSFTNNNFSGNWYGQIVDRQTGGSLPAPGGSAKNFSGNWYGTAAPVITSANSSEPGYAAQIPVEFGGSAVPPGGQPDIAGPASANFDITPYLATGSDTNSGAYADAYGFQGDFSALYVTAALAQTGATGRVQEGINLLANGALTGGARTVHVLGGTYQENPTANKALTLSGPNAGTAGSAVRAPEAAIVTNGNQASVLGISSSNVTVDGLSFDGDDPSVLGAPLTGSGSDHNAIYGIGPGGGFSSITIRNNIVRHVEIAFRGDGASTGNLITANWFDDIGKYDFGYAVSLRTEYYADVTNNKFTKVWSALHTNNFHLAGAPASWSFTGNEVHSYAGGVLNWLEYGSARSLTIDNNSFTAEAGAVANNSAIEFVTVQDGVTPTVTNNTITGYDYGVIVTNCTGSTPITIGSTNSIAGPRLAGVLLSNHLTFNAVNTTTLDTLGSYGGAGRLNVVGLSITGALADGIAVNAVTGSPNTQTESLSATGNTHVAGSSAAGSGIRVTGPAASATVKDNQLTFTGFAYGALVDAGKALIENTNLTGNSSAGIRVQNNGKVDAGDCAGSNFTGLGTGSGTAGSSAGNNTLTGYGFDNASPWAVDDANSSGQFNVLAQNNNYGATSQSIGLLVSDSADNAALSTVIYSQSGGQGISAAVASNDYCNFAVPASVTFTATYAGPGTIEWHDGTCTGTIIGTGNPFVWNTPPSAPGTHTYYARVNDGCSVGCASTSILVHAAPIITANVELSGITSGNFTRCISFDLFDGSTCPNPAYSHEEAVSFTSGMGSVQFPAPCGTTYLCVTARDRLHTLRRTIDGGHFIPSGNDYTVNFTDTKALISGNLNDDNFIDILDFGGFIGRYGQSDLASTNCSTTGLHPDFDGNGSVGTEDFNFISFSFLAAREPDCCNNALAEGSPVTEISVITLAATDYEMARTADLNRDGLLNIADAAFFGQHGLTRCQADFYPDGVVNVQDIFMFLNNWFSGFPAADINDDHTLNTQDIFDFINAWFTGC
jgi:hypothetical protein